MEMRCTEYSQVFERKKAPSHHFYPVIALKNGYSYLAGGDIYRTKKCSYLVHAAFKLYEEGEELYSHQFERAQDIHGAVYSRALRCYFLVLNSAIYRKDVNEKPPYPYMTNINTEDLVAVKAHPDSSERLFLVFKDRIKIINLPRRKISLSFKNDSKDRKNNRKCCFFGPKGESLAVILSKRYLTIVNFIRRKSTHETDGVEKADTDIFEYAVGSIAVSDDQRYIFASHSCHWNYRNFRCFLNAFKVEEDCLERKFDLNCQEMILSHTFFRRSGEKYVLILFRRHKGGYMDRCFFMFDSGQKSLERMYKMHGSFENVKEAACYEIFGNKMFVLDQRLVLERSYILEV